MLHGQGVRGKAGLHAEGNGQGAEMPARRGERMGGESYKGHSSNVMQLKRQNVIRPIVLRLGSGSELTAWTQS